MRIWLMVELVVVRPVVSRLGARAGAIWLKSLMVIGPFLGDGWVDLEWWVMS